MYQDMIVIGENLNATRKVKAEGKMVVDMGGGKKGYPYKSIDGVEQFLDLSEALRSEAVQTSGMVGYIAAGIINRDEEFICAIAGRQVAAGADFLDCCVDEISPWQKERIEHMKWLVRTVQKYTRVPLSIDSSDPDAIRAGLEVYDMTAGRPLLNSVNLEPNRIPIIAIAREAGASLLGNASGSECLPSNIEERIGNLGQLMKMMDEQEIPLDRRTLDPLVLPIGTDPQYGHFFLESCRLLREKYGPEIHLTGGFSNVSFGLPNRKLLNNAMTYLAREAGCDTAFIDPATVAEFRPEDEDFQKAIAALKGEDMYCIEYITYCRSL